MRPLITQKILATNARCIRRLGTSLKSPGWVQGEGVRMDEVPTGETEGPGYSGFCNSQLIKFLKAPFGNEN
jgi:hypothetical protein